MHNDFDKKKETKLSTLIIIIIGITIIILNMLQSAFISNAVSKITTKNYEDECKEITKAYTSRLEGKLEEYYGLLYAYTTSDVVQTMDNAKIVKWLQEHQGIRAKDFNYVAWVDAEGNFSSDIATYTQVKDRSYFKEIMELGYETTVDEPVTSKTTGKTVIHVCRAAKANGKTIGFFCAVMEMESFVHLVDGFRLGETGIGNLLTKTGSLIATSGNREQVQAELNFITSQKEVYNEIQKNLNTDCFTFWAKGTQNNKLFVTSSSIKGTPWGFNFIIEDSQIYATSNHLKFIMIFTSLIVGFILSAIVGTIVFISLKPLKVVQTTIKGIASGNADLTKRIEIKSTQNNEINRVVKSFNTFAEKLHDIMKELKTTKDELVVSGDSMGKTAQETSSAITQITANIQSVGKNINSQTDSVNQTSGAVNEIASNIESLNHMIEGQASSVSQAASAVEQMISNISSVNNSIDKMASSFETLQINAQSGISMKEMLRENVSEIDTQSKMLNEANLAIASIAEQTNLLAMNAAIEAAHAGEAGKGFAVVADEIRKLSETSSAQSKTIGEQLKNIQETISTIVEVSKNVGESFNSINDDIYKTDDLVRLIKSAMKEQNEGSKQITDALSHMNDSTSEVKTASYEMAEGNKAILAEIKKLQDASINLKQSMEEISIGAKTINESGVLLSTITNEVKTSIDKIGNQVDLFKV